MASKKTQGFRDIKCDSVQGVRKRVKRCLILDSPKVVAADKERKQCVVAKVNLGKKIGGNQIIGTVFR